MTLLEPLDYEHISLSLGDNRVQLRGEVGHFTRNIIVRGSQQTRKNTAIEACPTGVNRGKF